MFLLYACHRILLTEYRSPGHSPQVPGLRRSCGLLFFEATVSLVLLLRNAAAAAYLDRFKIAIGDFVVCSISTTFPLLAPLIDGECGLV